MVNPWLSNLQLTMFTAGILALLFDIELLAELVSIGALVVFTMVCSGDRLGLVL